MQYKMTYKSDKQKSKLKREVSY